MFRILSVLGIVFASLWILNDARKKGAKFPIPFLIGLAAVLLPVIVVPMYLLVGRMLLTRWIAKSNMSPKAATVLCPKCGTDNIKGTVSCIKCGSPLSL